MFKFIAVASLLLAVACAANVPALRFVSAIENITLDIYTNSFKTFSLNFTESTDYESVAGGSITVTNVINHETQESLIGGISQLVTFTENATLAFYQKNGTTYLVIFNETVPATINTNQTWIKLIDLGQDMTFVTLASTAGAVASYVGPLVNTPYVDIDPTTTSVRIYYSTSGNYNTPLILLNTSFNASDAYTVFYFTPSSGPVANIVFDRNFAGWSNPIATTGSITSGTVKATSGVILTSSGAKMTSGVAMTSSGAKMTSGVAMTSSGKMTTGAVSVSHVTTAPVIISPSPKVSSAMTVAIGFTTIVMSLVFAL